MAGRRRQNAAQGGPAQPDLMSLFEGFLAGQIEKSVAFSNRCLRIWTKTDDPVIRHLSLLRLDDAGAVNDWVLYRIDSMAREGKLHVTGGANLVALIRWLAREEILTLLRAADAIKRGGPGRCGRCPAPAECPTPAGHPPRPGTDCFSDLENGPEQLADRHASHEDHVDAKDAADYICRALTHPTWREIAPLLRDGCTPSQAARSTGRSADAVRQWLHRASALLERSEGVATPSASPRTLAPRSQPRRAPHDHEKT